ncbi:MAG: gamma-glutamylcyclotransferase family protein [Cyclobacteriaceae bacterium]
MEVFFYGLFMDRSILSKNGIDPSNPRKGYLKDYTLKIGDRASLIPCKNEKAYGIVMTVDDGAIKKLYAEPGVADYIPEEVKIVTDKNESVVAICYNLPVESLSGTNESYATSLYNLTRQKGFPEEYLEHIKEMTKTSD